MRIIFNILENKRPYQDHPMSGISTTANKRTQIGHQISGSHASIFQEMSRVRDIPFKGLVSHPRGSRENFTTQGACERRIDTSMQSLLDTSTPHVGYQTQGASRLIIYKIILGPNLVSQNSHIQILISPSHVNMLNGITVNKINAFEDPTYASNPTTEFPQTLEDTIAEQKEKLMI
ncbi:hypothetical protein LXL04_009337 [Taraxacum kok-saghyz]